MRIVAGVLALAGLAVACDARAAQQTAGDGPAYTLTVKIDDV